jgi:hypothetical protein
MLSPVVPLHAKGSGLFVDPGYCTSRSGLPSKTSFPVLFSLLSIGQWDFSGTPAKHLRSPGGERLRPCGHAAGINGKYGRGAPRQATPLWIRLRCKVTFGGYFFFSLNERHLLLPWVAPWFPFLGACHRIFARSPHTFNSRYVSFRAEYHFRGSIYRYSASRQLPCPRIALCWSQQYASSHCCARCPQPAPQPSVNVRPWLRPLPRWRLLPNDGKLLLQRRPLCRGWWEVL